MAASSGLPGRPLSLRWFSYLLSPANFTLSFVSLLGLVSLHIPVFALRGGRQTVLTYVRVGDPNIERDPNIVEKRRRQKVPDIWDHWLLNKHVTWYNTKQYMARVKFCLLEIGSLGSLFQGLDPSMLHASV